MILEAWQVSYSDEELIEVIEGLERRKEHLGASAIRYLMAGLDEARGKVSPTGIECHFVAHPECGCIGKCRYESVGDGESNG